MDQTAEEITTFDLWHDRHRVDVALLLRYAQRDAAVSSLGVVVAGVARKNTVEMTASQDQSPVEGTGQALSLDLHRETAGGMKRVSYGTRH